MKILSDELVVRLADALTEKQIAIQAGLQRIGVYPNEYDCEEVTDQLRDYVECCKGCHTWVAVFLLVGEGDAKCCKNCHKP